MNRLLSWLYTTRIWGPRPRVNIPTCPVCQKWAQHDEMFGGE